MSIEIEMKCAKCGAQLTHAMSMTMYPSDVCVELDPCETCMDNADTAGYERGVEETEEEHRSEANETDAKE